MIGEYELECTMAQRQPNDATRSAAGNGNRVFPPEATVHHGEVTREEVKRLRELVGIDFDDGNWETIDGFGQVVGT